MFRVILRRRRIRTWHGTLDEHQLKLQLPVAMPQVVDLLVEPGEHQLVLLLEESDVLFELGDPNGVRAPVLFHIPVGDAPWTGHRHQLFASLLCFVDLSAKPSRRVRKVA